MCCQLYFFVAASVVLLGWPLPSDLEKSQAHEGTEVSQPR